MVQQGCHGDVVCEIGDPDESIRNNEFAIRLGSFAILKPAISPTYMQNVKPLSIPDSVNASPVEHLPIFWDSTFIYVAPL